MADPTILAVTREVRFSPGKVEDDRAILEAVAAELRASGVDVRVVDADRLPVPDLRPKLALAMCQSEEALAWLERIEAHAAVVNSPAAIRNCYRIHMAPRLSAAGISQPRWVEAGDRFPAELGAKPWLKRGDVHAMEAGDVRRVSGAGEWSSALAELRERGIRSANVQEHVEGTVYKFYGVGGEFFRAFGLPEGRFAAAAALASAGARALALEVYGGDGVLAPDGSLRLIDFNDWPSFSRCRADAATAIARRTLEILENRTAHAERKRPSAASPRS